MRLIEERSKDVTNGNRTMESALHLALSLRYRFLTVTERWGLDATIELMRWLSIHE